MSTAGGPLSRRSVAIVWTLMVMLQLVFGGFMAWDELTDGSRARSNFESSPQAMPRDDASPGSPDENAESEFDGSMQAYAAGG